MTAKLNEVAMRDFGQITIVGAGPAGLACAIVLARSGARVVVREWKDRVGHRFHDDFQGLENWSAETDVLDELTRAGIASDFDHHPIDRGTVFDPAGRRHDVRGGRPLFYLLRRGSGEGTLDRALLAQALAAGVEVRFGDRVRAFDGAGILAAGPREAGVIAAGHIFDTDMRDGAWLALGHKVAPGGYAYLLVQGGRGTVASCMFTGFRDQARHVESAEGFFRAQAGLEMRNPRAFGGYGAYRWPRSATQGGHPVIGEHAGFQDALAGFGMRHAIRSGVLAAECLLDGGDYTARWQSELGPSLKAGIVNRWMFGLGGEFGMRLACRRLARGDAGDVLRRAYDLTTFRRLMLPLARRRYRKMLADPSCSHTDCDCVWCRHGDHGDHGVEEGKIILGGTT
ncbi:NAD(P)-binding protein [Aliiroseovarius sp.]|uniref:NAD(P)/FAD-dependent oxidoreductase n=1 Tax=Aliiroseovarius sp. TaxID=1872442 RepID=UPI002605CAD3|nr:NAD(P)-binding protein [Aliiroseovarius sp.]